MVTKDVPKKKAMPEHRPEAESNGAEETSPKVREKRPKQGIRIFISYRKAEPSKNEAKLLMDKLENEGFDIFFDKRNLKGGDVWANKIYDYIRASDMLIVLLQPETAESDWVQREVDVARGANIGIIPINLYFENSGVDVENAQKKLAIREYQFHHYCSEGFAQKLQEERNQQEMADAIKAGKSKDELEKLQKQHQENIKLAIQESAVQFEDLVHTIEMLAKKTREDQAEWWQKLGDYRQPKRARSKNSIATYRIKGGEKGCNLHIATGDLTDLIGIDVIVNSENNFMQMARIFERATLSSMLRQKGARMPHGRLLDDTLQDDLNAEIKALYGGEYGGVPIALGEVIITRSGHDLSLLYAKNKVRYILHAATILFSPIERKEALLPVQTERGISKVVKNCLEKFDEINSKQGDVLCNKARLEPNFKDVKSIIFPMLATGHGGRPMGDVIFPMLEAFRHHTEESVGSKLEDIYICVHAVKDIGYIKEVLKSEFGDPIS